MGTTAIVAVHGGIETAGGVFGRGSLHDTNISVEIVTNKSNTTITMNRFVLLSLFAACAQAFQPSLPFHSAKVRQPFRPSLAESDSADSWVLFRTPILFGDWSAAAAASPSLTLQSFYRLPLPQRFVI